MRKAPAQVKALNFEELQQTSDHQRTKSELPKSSARLNSSARLSNSSRGLLGKRTFLLTKTGVPVKKMDSKGLSSESAEKNSPEKLSEQVQEISEQEVKARGLREGNLEDINIESVDPNDSELVEHLMRDSLIKAFMVIFTNEQSKHLLLNKDLIEIAFNCLEFCNECTLEAKRHVARLMSVIFKFP